MKTFLPFVAGVLVACAAPAFSADNTPAAARQRYEAERSRCLNGQSHQDRATCLREAGAARQESGRGGLATDGTQLPRHAVARCEAQPVADRAACMARLQGAGKTEGSVEGGGVIRETETRVQ